MKSKIVYLDGLRGLAACIVVISHFFQVFAPSVFEGRTEIEHFAFENIAARTPLNLVFNGNFSVCLFFVLSGYVLSCKFFQMKDNHIIYSSATRRYFRLAAPAFLSVILAYLIVIFGLGAFDNIRGITLSSMPDPFVANTGLLTMLKEGLFNTFFTYGSQYNPVLWTMTYELLGSFLIFAFLLILGRRSIRFAGYAILIYFFIDSYYLGFVLGMLLSDLKNSNRDWLAYINRPWVNVLMLFTGIYAGSYPYINPQGTLYSVLVWESANFSFFVFYHVIGSFLIITALLNSSRMQSLFNLKLFAYLGKVSFSLYLVHFTIICSFGSFIFLQFSTFLPYGINVLLTAVITLLVIFAIAHTFYRFVDAKALFLLARWNERMFKGEKYKGIRRSVPSEKSFEAD
ncbi:MAG: acyltransferase family protein [Bacillota bacterium]